MVRCRVKWFNNEKGYGFNQDYKKAFDYYTKAYQIGDSEAFGSVSGHLGEMYYNGWYVEKDFDKAFKYLKEGAESKDNPSARAMRLLSACYRYGLGTTKDETKEKYWLEEAAKHKDKKAINILDAGEE